MNKKLGIALGAVAAAVVLGLGIYQSTASTAGPELSSDQVRQMVTDQYPGTITEIELAKDINDTIYEVVVESDGKIYNIRLDGNNGEVRNLKEIASSQKESSTENDADKMENPKNQVDSQDDTDNDNHNDHQDNSINNENREEESGGNGVIGKERAKEIALGQFSGRIEDIEQDEDDGRLIYEIEIVDGEDEASIEIDAYTAEVIALEIDREND
ncbi:PepSY domain-containing protein [Virgibacillus ainsalahensis]